jgi:hypothetical protein
MSTGIFGQAEFDGRAFKAPAKGNRHDEQGTQNLKSRDRCPCRSRPH